MTVPALALPRRARPRDHRACDVAVLLNRINGTPARRSSTPSGPPRDEHRLGRPRSRTAPAAPRRRSPSGTLNTVTTSSSLVFQVTIHNGGISQEVQIPVTLDDQPAVAAGRPDHEDREGAADRPGPGADGHVQRPRRGAVRLRRRRSTVDVRPVPGETNLSNNSAPYHGHLLAPVVGDASVGERRRTVAVVGSSSARPASSLAWVAWVARAAAAGRAADARRRRAQGPGRVRGLAAGADRRPASRGRRGRRRARAGRPAGRRHRREHARSCATTPTRTRAATSRPRSRSSTRPEPGSSITAIQGRDYARIYMKEIDRGQPGRGALARGAAGRRARDGPLRAARLEADALPRASGTFQAACSRFWS